MDGLVSVVVRVPGADHRQPALAEVLAGSVEEVDVHRLRECAWRLVEADLQVTDSFLARAEVQHQERGEPSGDRREPVVRGPVGFAGSVGTSLAGARASTYGAGALVVSGAASGTNSQ